MKKYLLIAFMTTQALAVEPWDICKFEGEDTAYKPVAQCTVYNGLLSKRAHHLVEAMKACVGQNDKGEYLFKSNIEKSIYMKDRSVIDLNKELVFNTVSNDELGIVVKVDVDEVKVKKKKEKKKKKDEVEQEEILLETDDLFKDPKKELVKFKIRQHRSLEGVKKTFLTLKTEDKLIRSLELKVSQRQPLWPIPATHYHLSMGCDQVDAPATPDPVSVE